MGKWYEYQLDNDKLIETDLGEQDDTQEDDSENLDQQSVVKEPKTAK